MEQLRNFFEEKPVQSILDVGCGNGNFIEVLKGTFLNAEIIGIDPNAEALEEGKARFTDVEFIEMKGENLEFANSSFDAASISMALHHLPNVLQTLGEMRRVVKPGGWIIVNELFSDNLNPAQEVHKMMHHFRSKIDRLNGICHNESFSKKEILDLIENAGIDIQLHFENKGSGKSTSPEEIAERKQKLRAMLEEVNHKPQYEELSKQVPIIEAALLEHGFEMATRLIVVGLSED